MKVLVIGGNRFFGKRLVSRLVDAGVEVTVMNRGSQDLAGGDGFGDRIRRIRCDRKTLKKNHPALSDENWDIIYDQVCYDAHEAKSACEAFSGRFGHYVFTSSESVYDGGAATPESLVDTTNYRFDAIADPKKDYAEAKRQCEAVFFSAFGTKLTAVRFSLVLGSDDYTERLKFHVERVAKEVPIYFPAVNSKISFIQSQDAAAFLDHLRSIGPVGAVNCCAAEPVSLRLVLDWIEQATGKRAALVEDPALGEESPYGVAADWSMSTSKLASLGFKAVEAQFWMPELIRSLVGRELKPHRAV